MPAINPRKIEEIRHTGAHLLAHAVLNLFGPKTKFGIGPVIETGFYYDFALPRPITPEDLPKIEKEMRALAKKNLSLQKENYAFPDAVKMMKKAGQTFKLDLLNDIKKGGRKKVTGVGKNKVSFYRLGEFLDLCKGGHAANTRAIPLEGLKVSHTAGAYWKGNEKNPMLTRIYVLAFATKKELDTYLQTQEDAEKRDHKKLGSRLDLFTFSDLVGPGLPLWAPRGTLLRILLDDYIWQLRKERGYERVEIPHITKKELFQKSGHWDKFRDELFKIKTREGHEFAMKPMNCPHHTQIYARRQFSYRELPQRYANTTMCYRDEQTGELSGLSRVRSFTQDDAHVFCRYSQIKDEFWKVWDIVDEFYCKFGFKLDVRLSMHNPKEPQKYLGSPKTWQVTENILRKLVKQRKVKVYEAHGEAAFYGPKIDFMAKDSLGREWQVATIQLDINMPERFDLVCTNEKGVSERVAMIHAAIMGSIERFVSILIEHFAGVFPLWLSPVQVAILPISDGLNSYAREVEKKLQITNQELRIMVDERSESIGKKIREAEQQKIPYMLVVGKKEREAKNISVRRRGEKDLGTMTIAEFAKKITKEISRKAL